MGTKPRMTEELERDLDDMLQEIEAIGTEIELKLKLAGMEARDTWRLKLEPRLFDARMHAKEAKDEAKRAMKETLKAFKEFAAVL